MFSKKLNKSRLRILFVVFFAVFSAPTIALIQQAFSQLKWEAFHQQRILADELAQRINRIFSNFIETEEARSFADYAFLNVAGDPESSFLQRSPLSEFPPNTNIPGLIGYFQIDTKGSFSSPVLPANYVAGNNYGINNQQYTQRLELQNRLLSILKENRLANRSNATHSKLVMTGTVDDSNSMLNEEEDMQSEPLITSPAYDGFVEGRSMKKSMADMDYADNLSSDGSSAAMGGDFNKDLPSSIAEEINHKEPAEMEQAVQANFDQLNSPDRQAAPASTNTFKSKKSGNLGRLQDLKMDDSYGNIADKQQAESQKLEKTYSIKKRAARKEREVLPEVQKQANAKSPEVKGSSSASQTDIKISIFESEIDPLEFSLLDSGHFVVYRKVWRNGQRYIQGMLFEQQPLLNGLIASEYRSTSLATASNLIIAYQDQVLGAFSATTGKHYFNSAEEISGTFLGSFHLSAPFNQIELLFNIKQLPTGPAGTFVSWVSLVLMITLAGGLYLMYRLALRQLQLTQQQQNFVSAVSHELKTPLTSIRMYGELLQQGWATEEKKKTYYDFISEESERLSRLIENVLQLARMDRNDLNLDIKEIGVAELTDNIQSKISTQVERAGFLFNLSIDSTISTKTIAIDTDAFIQIIINLTDNAIKFSSNAEKKLIEVKVGPFGEDGVVFSIRDYGPGIDHHQIKKIFKLFYRTENELTRKTTGTGIGLALVHQLTLAMKGQIDVVNREPGVEFLLRFKLQTQ